MIKKIRSVIADLIRGHVFNVGLRKNNSVIPDLIRDPVFQVAKPLENIKKSFILILMLFSSIAFAANQDASSQLAAKLSNIKTMTADFHQVIYDQQGHFMQYSDGQMKLKSPGLFYWHETKPLEQLIIAKQQNVVIYDPTLNQVSVRQLSDADSTLPMLLLSQDASKLLSEFNVSSDDGKEFKMVPKDKESMLKLIDLVFNGDQLANLGFKNYLMQTSKIWFKNEELNSEISDEVFNFKNPEGADVVNFNNQNSNE